MKLDNNKDFFEFVESLLDDTSIIADKRLYLTEIEPLSFDTIVVGCLLWDVKSIIDSNIYSLLVSAYNKRFYSGLDIEC